MRLLTFSLLMVAVFCAGCGSMPKFYSKGGDWVRVEGAIPVLQRRGAGTERSVAHFPVAGDGRAWRCVMEPGPYAGSVEFGVGLDADGEGGLWLALCSEGGGSVILRDSGGTEFWRDQGVGWAVYSPLWLECVLEARRVRVQVLDGKGEPVISQSPWVPLPKRVVASGHRMGLATVGNTARFCLCERAEEALATYSADNPSALRVPRAGETEWVVVGGGAWRWKDSSRTVLQQTRNVERTTAFWADPLPVEGTWRCGIRLDRSTCGGGMAVHANQDLTEGYLVWLGGTYGNGRLMLYRYPLACVWSGKDGKWKWDTDYVLEAAVREGRIQATLFESDGKTVIDRGKWVSLVKEELGRRGMRGFQTWRGTGCFGGFSGSEDAEPSGGKTGGPASAERVLGAGWRELSGTCAVSGEGERLALSADSGPASAVCDRVRGARGVFRCRVVPGDTEAVSLLFQWSADGKAGFECRLDGDGFSLRDASGTVLWNGDGVRLESGRERILEGIVSTDRVQIAVRDASGAVLGESVERYVSDTNNERVGLLGVRCEGGKAAFSGWEWHPE